MTDTPPKQQAQLDLKVIPGAKTEAIVGWLGERLKIRIRAPADKGRANQAVIALLAKQLKLPKSAISIRSGHSQANKSLIIEGLSQDAVDKQLPTR